MPMKNKKPTAVKKTAKKQVMKIRELFSNKVGIFDPQTGERLPDPPKKPKKKKDPQTKIKF